MVGFHVWLDYTHNYKFHARSSYTNNKYFMQDWVTQRNNYFMHDRDKKEINISCKIDSYKS
jgi:hypothetical protein